MTAGDIGVDLVISTGGYVVPSEATCSLIVAPKNGATLSPLTPLTIAEDGLSVTYVTTGADFTVGGPWSVQLEVSIDSEHLYTSPEGTLYVYPHL